MGQHGDNTLFLRLMGQQMGQQMGQLNELVVQNIISSNGICFFGRIGLELKQVWYAQIDAADFAFRCQC